VLLVLLGPVGRAGRRGRPAPARAPDAGGGRATHPVQGIPGLPRA